MYLHEIANPEILEISKPKKKGETAMIDGWAPVAEYKSVCLLEKGGTKRAVWKRREYATDGYIYLRERSPDGDESVTTYAVPNSTSPKRSSTK